MNVLLKILIAYSDIDKSSQTWYGKERFQCNKLTSLSVMGINKALILQKGFSFYIVYENVI